MSLPQGLQTLSRNFHYPSEKVCPTSSGQFMKNLNDFEHTDKGKNDTHNEILEKVSFLEKKLLGDALYNDKFYIRQNKITKLILQKF